MGSVLTQKRKCDTEGKGASEQMKVALKKLSKVLKQKNLIKNQENSTEMLCHIPHSNEFQTISLQMKRIL